MTLFLIYIFAITQKYNNTISNVILVSTKIKRGVLFKVYYDIIENVNIFEMDSEAVIFCKNCVYLKIIILKGRI